MLHMYEVDAAVALFLCCMIFELMLHETTYDVAAGILLFTLGCV